MRLKQYMIETININDETSFDDIIQFLWRKCNPFLKDLLKPGWNGEFLYSGIPKLRDIYIDTIRKGEQETYTNKSIEDGFDRMFYKKFKTKFISESIFCTGDPDFARNNGSVFIIFPINKYKFVYSTNKKTYYNRATSNEIISARNEYYYDDDTFNKIVDMYAYEIIKKYYRNDSIINAIKSGNEIMVHCKEYMAISYEKYYDKLKSYYKINGYKKPKQL